MSKGSGLGTSRGQSRGSSKGWRGFARSLLGRPEDLRPKDLAVDRGHEVLQSEVGCRRAAVGVSRRP